MSGIDSPRSSTGGVAIAFTAGPFENSGRVRPVDSVSRNSELLLGSYQRRPGRRAKSAIHGKPSTDRASTVQPGLQRFHRNRVRALIQSAKHIEVGIGRHCVVSSVSCQVDDLFGAVAAVGGLGWCCDECSAEQRTCSSPERCFSGPVGKDRFRELHCSPTFCIGRPDRALIDVRNRLTVPSTQFETTSHKNVGQGIDPRSRQR